MGQRFYIYVSVVSSCTTQPTGQNHFETAFIKGLIKRFSKRTLAVLTTHEGSDNRQYSKYPNVHSIRLKKKSYLNYFYVQIVQFLRLFAILAKNRHRNPMLIIRYHDSMVSPILLTYLFQSRYILRTGPVHFNLKNHHKHIPSPITFFVSTLSKLFFRNAKKIVCVSTGCKKYLQKYYSLPDSKIVVIPNCVDCTDIPKPATSSIHPPWIFTFVGTVYKDQGLDIIIKALTVLDPAIRESLKVRVIGSGPQEQELKNLAAKLKVDHLIEWMGWKPKSELWHLLRTSHYGIAPFPKIVFRTTGSSALKIFEYLACGLPVIASEGEDHQFLRKNNLGLLVPPESHTDWAKAMVRVSDTNKFSAFSDGRIYVEAHHSLEKMVDDYLAAFS